MDEKELTEVPLSNMEVLKVLKAKNEISPEVSEMIAYLESVENNKCDKYPLEHLREIRGIKADLVTLAVVSNLSDLSLLSDSDRKLVEQKMKNRQ
jgi:hypothetical protein